MRTLDVAGRPLQSTTSAWTSAAPRMLTYSRILTEPKEARMGQVYTCPSCAKKIADGQEWSLIWKQGDVEIRAHAEVCAIRAMDRFHPAPSKPALRAVTPKKKR
jgi:hypothetical protein